jgi:hypothetical protein
MRSMTIAVCLGLAACSQPVEQTRTLDERPSILVQGAPVGAVLQVDGLAAGMVQTLGGVPQAIRIEPGSHLVAVIVNGKPILSDRVFVSGAVMKTLTVPPGGP